MDNLETLRTRAFTSKRDHQLGAAGGWEGDRESPRAFSAADGLCLVGGRYRVWRVFVDGPQVEIDSDESRR